MSERLTKALKSVDFDIIWVILRGQNDKASVRLLLICTEGVFVNEVVDVR